MSMLKKDKIAGAVYGFAIGDAMGATTEFMDEEQIKEKYGKVTDIIGGGWLKLRPGEVTDDTQMMMCVMDAIQKRLSPGLLIEECKKNFIKWYQSNPKDIGTQCDFAIRAMMMGFYVHKDDSALGNGSLMRALPLAILGLKKLNVSQGKLTHNNSTCSYCIEVYSDEIASLINGGNARSRRNLIEPSGHVLNTMNNSLYWCSNSKTFEEAIVGAVNHGGDADTIAALAGGLAGAKFGFGNIPERWINALGRKERNRLDNFVNFAREYLGLEKENENV